MKTYSVLVACSSGRFMVYLVSALNENIAIDACLRSTLQECPEQSFSMTKATEISLMTPMKIMDSGSE